MTKHEELHRLHDREHRSGEHLDPALLDEADWLRLQAIEEVSATLRNTLLAESEEVDLWPDITARLEEIDRTRQKKTVLRRWRERLTKRAVLALPAMAAAAAAVVLWVKLQPPVVTNGCDIEYLDVAGGSATVLQLPDDHENGPTTTVIWVDESQ